MSLEHLSFVHTTTGSSMADYSKEVVTVWRSNWYNPLPTILEDYTLYGLNEPYRKNLGYSPKRKLARFLRTMLESFYAQKVKQR